MENRKQFKPYDRVIYRLNNSNFTTSWHCGIFSDYNKQNNHITLCSGFTFLLDKYVILPYEGNEGLVGTSDEPEEEIKLEEGEWIMASNICRNDPSTWRLEQAANIKGEDWIETKNGNHYYYVIKFSDFKPSNMEETRKHILCVKNGKIMKYKG